MDKKGVAILTPVHIRALDLLFSEEAFAKAFYLTGGTALAAFYLKHRHSDDLDFFSNESDLGFLLPMLQRLERSNKLILVSRTPSFIRAQFENTLKIDFVQDVPFRIGVPQLHHSWRIDSLENITVNKVSAIQGRLDIKDYVDLYFLIKNAPEKILELLDLAKKKDRSIDPFLWSRIIGDVANLTILPRMIRPVRHETLVDFFSGLKKIILSSLKPRN